jgi:hypothetical protein
MTDILTQIIIAERIVVLVTSMLTIWSLRRAVVPFFMPQRDVWDIITMALLLANAGFFIMMARGILHRQDADIYAAAGLLFYIASWFVSWLNREQVRAFVLRCRRWAICADACDALGEIAALDRRDGTDSLGILISAAHIDLAKRLRGDKNA